MMVGGRYKSNGHSIQPTKMDCQPIPRGLLRTYYAHKRNTMDMICRQPFLALQYFFQKDKTCASKTKESMQIISDIHHFMNDTNGSFRLLETRAASCMW